ncbi:hypothetical protein ACS0TY_026413 [Phlomoides rotata]
MASFTFKPLQQTQLQLSSFSHCNYSSTLNTFQFHISSDSTKHAFTLQANARVPAHFETTFSAEQISRNDVNTASTPDFRSGFSSLTDKFKGDSGKSPERNGIGEKNHSERGVILKDRHAKSGLNSNRRKEVGSGVNSSRFESKNVVRNSDGKKLEQKEKRIKKSKVDPLRVGLDMCSKRGDVVGAINLYDLAKKEGVKLGQYHYAVLLYLCSSAATGVVHAAKSGSSTRILRENSGFEMAKKSEENELSINGDRAEVTISDGEGDLGSCLNDSLDISGQTLDSLVESIKKISNSRDDGNRGFGIQVSENMKQVALRKGFELYDEMRSEKVAMNEATFTSVARMAIALGDGDMAFQIVKQMKEHGVNPRLRSYSPALAIFCNNGDVENAFEVEKHMLENGVFPEEPELEALLKVCVETGKSDKVYDVLHKLRTSVRQVSSTTADLIEKWFRTKVASRIGKRKWDQESIIRSMENRGGGWHGKGWLGRGKWTTCRTSVGTDGVCKCCGEKLVTIDLDPAETEKFAESVASIAVERERNSSFQKFQKWLDYYGPFEAVVDAANIGLYSQRKFKPSKVNAVVNGIRQMLPSRKWPLIVLHNRRITGEKMDKPFNRALIDRWRNADALYATPTGSNDDWYWLYAAIKCKCLLVTNDEMRDHLFQLLGNDFFPRWKERHQVHFSFTETGPTFRMPPPCSVVIQESEKGHWHVPIVSELENEDERKWLCCSRGNSSLTKQDSSDEQKGNYQMM